ncbi:MAG: hypothetical protein N2578_10175, partial [Bdellovibrionaceae bacterium]|nr:hypothetical protein [Pseudobdellovibrionaceae bacterium]
LAPTETPTPTPTLSAPREFADAVENNLIWYDQASGSFLVRANLRAPDGSLTEQTFTLVENTFSLNEDIKNPLAPKTVKALDEKGAEYTLIWTGSEFRVAYEFPTLFEGVGTENPTLNQENLEQVPFIPIEDIQSGLAAQSVLLAMQQDGYQPFGEEAAKAYADLGGYSLLFELKNGYKTADLKSWVNWTRSADYPNNGKGINYENLSMKFSPYWMRTEINGKTYDVPAIVLFNPQDPKNPSPDEFLVVFGVPHAAKIISLSSDYDITSYYALYNTGVPSRIHLFAQRADGKPLDPNSPNLVESLLSQLLAIEGNDASEIAWAGQGYSDLAVNINYWINQLNQDKTIVETPIPPSDALPPQLQKMFLLVEAKKINK